MARSRVVVTHWISVIILLFTGFINVGGQDEHPHDVDVDKILASYQRYSGSKLFIGTDFWMGINDRASETGEHPFKKAKVGSFYMDQFPVLNVQYWAYAMKKRKYRTTAEKKRWSWVFGRSISRTTKKNMSVPGTDNWFAVRRADWEHPEGIDSNITKKWLHPVVHISLYDAREYCRYRNKRLPTEQEWERAARGGRISHITEYPWGEDWSPRRANTFQGRFPFSNSGQDGYYGTSPADAYPPQNDYDMYDMLGNVWEWTNSRFVQRVMPADLAETQVVLKGTSHLDSRRRCTHVVRTSQRMAQAPDYTASNVGFRCVQDAPYYDTDHYKLTVQKLEEQRLKRITMMRGRIEL